MGRIFSFIHLLSMGMLAAIIYVVPLAGGSLDSVATTMLGLVGLNLIIALIGYFTSGVDAGMDERSLRRALGMVE